MNNIWNNYFRNIISKSEFFFLCFNAIGIFSIEFSISFQCSPIRRFTFGTLITRPCRNGNKNSCFNRFCKILTTQLCKVFSYLSNSNHFSIRDFFHYLVIVDWRCKIHFVPAIFFYALYSTFTIDITFILRKRKKMEII